MSHRIEFSAKVRDQAAQRAAGKCQSCKCDLKAVADWLKAAPGKGAPQVFRLFGYAVPVREDEPPRPVGATAHIFRGGVL